MSESASDDHDYANPDLVRALHNKVIALEEEVNELREQVESENGSGESGAGGRDQAVMEALSPGQRVGIPELKSVYRSRTDINQTRTLKRRVKSITNRPEFEKVAHATWVYVGGESDEQ